MQQLLTLAKKSQELHGQETSSLKAQLEASTTLLKRKDMAVQRLEAEVEALQPQLTEKDQELQRRACGSHETKAMVTSSTSNIGHPFCLDLDETTFPNSNAKTSLSELQFQWIVNKSRISRNHGLMWHSSKKSGSIESDRALGQAEETLWARSLNVVRCSSRRLTKFSCSHKRSCHKRRWHTRSWRKRS